MNDQQYFMTTSLSYQLKAAKEELASFQLGEAYVKLTTQVNHNYENSSLPSSQCIDHKKSQTTGKKRERSQVHRRDIPIIHVNP